MMKKIIIAIGVIGILGGVFAYLEFNKEHKDFEAEPASVHVTAVDLFDAYVVDEKAANDQYLDKVIAVSGIVSETVMEDGSSLLVLQTNDDFFGVNASFDETADVASARVGDNLTIKGRCTGGDEMGVVLINCTVIK